MRRKFRSTETALSSVDTAVDTIHSIKQYTQLFIYMDVSSHVKKSIVHLLNLSLCEFDSNTKMWQRMRNVFWPLIYLRIIGTDYSI